jgi:hypothetical protein
MGVSGRRHAPAAFWPWGMDPRWPLDRRLGGPQSWPEHRLEESLCRGSKPDRPVVQFVVRHYTDWAIRLAMKDTVSLIVNVTKLLLHVHNCIFCWPAGHHYGPRCMGLQASITLPRRLEHSKKWLYYRSSIKRDGRCIDRSWRVSFVWADRLQRGHRTEIQTTVKESIW